MKKKSILQFVKSHISQSNTDSQIIISLSHSDGDKRRSTVPREWDPVQKAEREQAKAVAEEPGQEVK